jgi:hypothetical protein
MKKVGFNKRWGILALVAAVILLLSACSKTKAPVVQAPAQKPTPVPVSMYETVAKGVSPLTGLPYKGDGKAIMVLLENDPAARPQSGITKADLIYEMEAEGYVTKITAFFLSNYPTKVGPVRSVRKQQMYLWSEWNYMYVYWGGSVNVPGQDFNEIKKSLGINAPGIDGTVTSAGLFRSSDRLAPHNAYANLDYLKNNAYNFVPKQRTLYFDANASIKGTPATSVSLSYSSALKSKYIVKDTDKITYVYDSGMKLYGKSIGGNPVVDKEDGTKLYVKNIIVQHARHYFVAGTVYTNIDLVGSGKAEYFTEGVMRTGTWERKNTNSLTKYYDENGKEIAFKPGTTYVQIVRTDATVTVE